MNNSSKESRMGQVVTNKDGEKMQIIDYRDCNDITVQFEDGNVVEHKRYSSFIAGTIRNYGNRLNEEKTNKAGLKMKVVAYRNSEDIDVQFEDGTIVKTRYKHFSRGSVKNPNEHVGETFTLRSKHIAKILKYNSFYDVTVQLDNGETVSGVCYRTLQRGGLGRNPKFE